MPYLNLDDNYHDHPKVAALSDAAYRLHGGCMFYVAKFTLDGYLTLDQIKGRKGYKPVAIRELQHSGLLHGIGDGCSTKTCPTGREGFYLLHDFLQWNKSRDWWDTKRKKDAERLAKWRAEHGNESHR